MPRLAINDAVNRAPLKFAEYLLLEEKAATKHEFVDGFMFAMAGASEKHNFIALNIASTANFATRESSCDVFLADIKLQINEDVTYYPDVLITCDERDRGENVKHYPCCIVEVLSKSTADLDHGEKWLNYQRLETLKMYVMVHQTQMALEVYRRQPDGTWHYELLTSGELHFACIDLKMTLSEVYKKVNFGK
jgi:Uma2 family endonuclease